MNDPGPRFRTFHRSFRTPAGGPIGCLATLILCPIGLVAALVMLVVSMFRLRRVVRAAGAAAAAASPREVALRRLVAAFAQDESFTADEVRQAGTLAAGGATADELLTDAMARGWIAPLGDRLAVTPRGREASGGPDAARPLEG